MVKQRLASHFRCRQQRRPLNAQKIGDGFAGRRTGVNYAQSRFSGGFARNIR